MDDGLEKALDRLDKEVDRVFGLNDSPSYRSKTAYSSKTGFTTEYSPPGAKGDTYRYPYLWSPSPIAEPTTPSPTREPGRWTQPVPKPDTHATNTPIKYNLCQSGSTCCGGSCGKGASTTKSLQNGGITLNPAGYSTRSHFKAEKSIADDIGALRGKFITPPPTREYRATHWDDSFSDLDSYLRKQRSRLDRLSTTMTGLEDFVHRGFADPKFL